MEPIIIDDDSEGDSNVDPFLVQLYSGETREFSLGSQHTLDLAAINEYLTLKYPNEGGRLLYDVFFVPKNQSAPRFALEGNGGAPDSLLSLLKSLRIWFNDTETAQLAQPSLRITRTKERDAFLRQRLLFVVVLAPVASEHVVDRLRGERVSIRPYRLNSPDKQLVSDYADLIERLALDQEYRLFLTNPLKENEMVDEPWRITFLAIEDGTQALVGFCSCYFVRYRAERAERIVSRMETFTSGRQQMAKTKWVKWLREKKQREKSLPAQHFAYDINSKADATDNTLGNLFIIDALSVLPTHSGQGIGMVLLHAAMGFVRDVRIRTFFPVSHIACHAASFVTKKLLISTYDCRYYGTNQFVNEHFVSTLDNDQKTTLVNLINALLKCAIDVIDLYLRRNEDDDVAALGRLFDSDSGEPKKLLDGIIVQLYQLYLLIIQTVVEQRAQAVGDAMNFFNDEVMGHFRVLFRMLKQDGYEQGTLNERMFMQGKGFIKLPKDDRRTKLIYEEGYDVIYDATHGLITFVLTASAFSAWQTEIKTRLDTTTEQVLALTNGILEADLALPQNYTLPDTQIKQLLTHVFEVDYDPVEYPVQAARQNALLVNLQRRHVQMTEHEAFYQEAWITALDIVPKEEHSFHDTYLSMASLLANQGEIERRYLARIGRFVPDEEEQVPQSQPERSSQLEQGLNAVLDRVDEQEARDRAAAYVYSPTLWSREAQATLFNPGARTIINSIIV